MTAVTQRKVQLPTGVAIWVLGAHLYAILVPLALLPVLQSHWELFEKYCDYPELFYGAVVVMMMGSCFEVLQNHHDKWYISADTASAHGSSNTDMFFYTFIVLSAALIAIACKGNTVWLSALMIVLVVAQPILYKLQKGVMVPFASAGLLSTGSAYAAFGDPVILLQLALPAATMFFFGLLLKTGNQILHGFTTAVASSGVLFLIWGVLRTGMVAVDGWLVVIAVVIASTVILLGLRRFLAALPATPRPA